MFTISNNLKQFMFKCMTSEYCQVILNFGIFFYKFYNNTNINWSLLTFNLLQGLIIIEFRITKYFPI